MHARVTSFQGKPEGIEEAIRNIRDQVMPAAQKISGFKAGYWLIDRKTGKGYAFTLWETEQAMRASEDAAGRLRDQSSQATGATVSGVERFEVAVYTESPSKVAAR